MKRDMDLARSIMLALEESANEGAIDIKIEGHTSGEISYHVMLLDDAGLIKALNASSFGNHDWKPLRLTWEGHEFLDASRDEGRWKKAKKIMADKAGGVSFEVVKQLLIQLMKDAVMPS